MKKRRVLSAAAVTAATLCGLSLAGAAPASADTVIGIFYADSGYGGSTNTSIVPGTTSCTSSTSNVDWQLGSFSSSWNDEIGSFRGYSNCYIKVWENINYGGASLPYTSARSSLGVLDDEVSSAQFS